MIVTAEEFVRLRSSTDPAEYGRAATEEAPLEVWYDVIDRFPDYRQWVAHNKTIPMEILEVLATDPDWIVRTMVASKNKLTPELMALLARDPREAVRHTIAHHKRAPRELLEELRNDPWDAIRILANERLARMTGD